MQLALRRGFGYAYPPRGMYGRRGMYGLGQDEVGTVTSNDPAILDQAPPLPSLPLPTTPIIPTTGPADLATLQACAADPNCSLPPGIDPSLLYKDPGYNITGVTPGAQLSTAELSAEQQRATSWLSSAVPGAVTTAGVLTAALSAAQIAAGVQAGALKPSSTCPSGYFVAGSGQCVGTTSASVLPGVSNTTLGIAAVVIFALLLMGGRR